MCVNDVIIQLSVDTLPFGGAISHFGPVNPFLQWQEPSCLLQKPPF